MAGAFTGRTEEKEVISEERYLRVMKGKDIVGLGKDGYIYINGKPIMGDPQKLVDNISLLVDYKKLYLDMDYEVDNRGFYKKKKK